MHYTHEGRRLTVLHPVAELAVTAKQRATNKSPQHPHDADTSRKHSAFMKLPPVTSGTDPDCPGNNDTQHVSSDDRRAHSATSNDTTPTTQQDDAIDAQTAPNNKCKPQLQPHLHQNFQEVPEANDADTIRPRFMSTTNTASSSSTLVSEPTPTAEPPTKKRRIDNNGMVEKKPRKAMTAGETVVAKLAVITVHRIVHHASTALFLYANEIIKGCTELTARSERRHCGPGGGMKKRGAEGHNAGYAS